MKNENIVSAAAPDALQDFTSCPEWGSGGQFLYDPLTKTRTRIGEAPAAAGAFTGEMEETPVPGAAAAAAEGAAQSKKERTRAS